MGENKSGELHSDKEGRRALGDVTNQVGNREFSLVTRSPASKPLSGNKRPAEDTDDDSQFWKQVSMVVERLEKERCGVAKCPKVAHNEVGLSPLRGGKTYRLQNGSGDGKGGVGSRDVANEIKEPSGSALDSIDLGENQHLPNVVIVDDEVKEGALTSECCEKKSLDDEKECLGEETRCLSDVGESDCNPEELATQVVSDDGKSAGGDCMASSRSNSAETSRFTESQETRSFGLERCRLLKGDNSNAGGMDLLKNCSCSFCTKAAYIWSDLQCQDIKGRISTLTKSQKEASSLAIRYSKESALNEDQGSSSRAPHLETDLTTLWKSLFLHMDNIYAAESSQLQSNFAVMKDVREDYKLNLEMINVLPPDIQQSSSDASEY